ncbi:MAG: AAA family ATPase [Thermomicrobiales bacterium]|nr:AAA family ATPase [Thermomicrobiales bacterium]
MSTHVSAVPIAGALPPLLTSLVGREQEIAQVEALLRSREARLVTITGPGGIGKTRLAVAVGERMASAFPDGVWFVDLAHIGDSSDVTAAIARAVGVHGRGGASPVEQLIALFAGRQVLLILDNFEHLRAAATQLIDLLAACAGVSILITSRIRLRVSGEWDVEVGPLVIAEPDSQHPGPSHDSAPAVELFLQRAAAAGVPLGRDRATRTIVEAICRRLDGIPLAIELAAARAKFLPPVAMLEHLEQSLPVLTGGGPDRPERHKTMANAIRWSYDLLSPPEQRLFAELSVFAGGFTAQAAREVCSATGDLDRGAAAEGIESLVEQSLVRSLGTSGSEARYGMLEPIREFASDLNASTPELEALKNRHARYFMALIDHPMPPFDAEVGSWVESAMRDERNLLAALDWSIRSGNAELAMRLGGALVFQIWSPMVRYREQRQWMQAILDMPAHNLDARRADVFSCLAWAEFCLGDTIAAQAAAEQSLDLATASGSETIAGWAYVIFGLIAMDRQDYPAAKRQFEEALVLADGNADLMLRTAVRNRLCVLLTLQERYDRAAVMIEESVAITEAAGDLWGLVDAHDSHVFLLRRSGKRREAAARGREFLRQSAELRSDEYLAYALESVVHYAVALRRYEEAARLLGAAGRFERHAGVAAPRMDEAEYERDLLAIQASLSPEAFHDAVRAGELLPVEEAVAEADLLIAGWGDQTDDASARFGLTGREREVLGLLAGGSSNRDIAAALFISVPTVKVHVRSILTKLGVESRTAAASFAIRSGLV